MGVGIDFVTAVKDPSVADIGGKTPRSAGNTQDGFKEQMGRAMRDAMREDERQGEPVAKRMTADLKKTLVADKPRTASPVRKSAETEVPERELTFEKLEDVAVPVAVDAPMPPALPMLPTPPLPNGDTPIGASGLETSASSAPAVAADSENENSDIVFDTQGFFSRTTGFAAMSATRGFTGSSDPSPVNTRVSYFSASHPSTVRFSKDASGFAVTTAGGAAATAVDLQGIDATVPSVPLASGAWTDTARKAVPLTAKAQEPPPLSPQSSSPPIKVDAAVPPEEVRVFGTTGVSPAAAATPEENAGRDVGRSSQDSSQREAAMSLAGLGWRTEHPASGSGGERQVFDQAVEIASVTGTPIRTAAVADAPEVEVSRGTDVRSRDFVVQAVDRIQMRTQELMPQPSSPSIKADVAASSEETVMREIADLSPAAADMPEEIAIPLSVEESDAAFESVASPTSGKPLSEHVPPLSRSEASQDADLPERKLEAPAVADAPEVEASRETDVRNRDFVMQAADRIQMRTQELMPQPSSPSIKADVAASSEETVTSEIADLSPTTTDTPEEIAIPLSSEESNTAVAAVASSTSLKSWKSGKPLSEHIPPSSRSEASQDADLPERKLEAPSRADAPEVEASRGTDVRSRDFVMQTPTPQPSSPSIKSDVAASSEETVTSEIADLSPAATDAPEEVAIPLSGEESNTAVAAVASSTSWKSGEPLSEYVPMPSRSEASQDADLHELKLETPAKADAQEESDGRDAGQSSQGSSQGEAAGSFTNLAWRMGTGHQGSGSGGERRGFDQAVEIAAATGTPIRTAAGAAASEIEASHGADARSRDLVTQVADRIQLQLRNSGGEIRIQLRPENLGKLEIRAEHGRDGLTARIATESREVKVLLESNLSSLQQMLEERGMKVNRLHIVVQDNTDTSGLSDGGNRSGHAFTGQQHRNTAQFSGRGETPDGGIETPAEEFADIPAARRPDSRFYTVA